MMNEKPLTLLPSFDVSQGLPGDDAIAAYERDGVVWLANAFSSDWVERLAEGMLNLLHDKAHAKAPSHTQQTSHTCFLLFWRRDV